MRDAESTSATGEAALDPYLPRLVLGWTARHGDARAVESAGSLVSADISGFTSLSERLASKGRIGAEELILLISGCFEGLIGIAQRFGGDVLKFRGDALLLFFDGAGHEERATRAASAMQWFIETTGSTMSSVGPVELGMATGIYSGPCHFFLVESTHRELVVTGPAATATITLEDLAERGEILVSAATASALPDTLVGAERDGARLVVRREPDASEAPDVEAALATADDPALYVPAPLREHLAVAGGEAEHRHVTVSFLKFSGSDEVIAHEGPEALLARLDELGGAVGAATERYGLTWLESDIDVNAGKLYLTAGAPASSGRDEEGMLRALRDVLDAGLALPLRAGVNRGAVFTGDIGAASRRTYAVMGDAVNLAARLTGRAGAGEILATADVLERASTRFATEQQPFLVKGKERAITAHRVGAAVGTRDERTAAPLPIVGRERELETLRNAVNAARMREQQVVEIVGEPGIGKSRLVQELATLTVGFAPFTAACEQYAASIPFVAWRDILRPLAGITPEMSREEAGRLLEPWVAAVMPEIAIWTPLLAIPFDAAVAPTPDTEALDPAASRDRLHEAVERFLERVLLMPTAIVFEDGHWMDDASRFLFLHLTSRPAQRPWLLCVTRRPGAEPFVLEGKPGTPIELEPLAEDAAAALALAAAQDFALSEEAVSTLAERSGGNPLFVRELVAAAREGGAVATLPETVETLMTARIDTLAPADRMLLRYASVVGPTFELELLEDVLDDEIRDAGSLDRWRGLSEFVVWVAEDTLAFRHDLVRATAYEGLSFRRRRAIHGRVGAALESRAGARADELAGLLSLHFLEAAEHEKAWRYSVLAGEQAEAKFANVVAAALLDRALAAAEHLPDLPLAERAQVAELLGDVSERFGGYEQAEAAFARAHDLRRGDGVAQARVMMKLGMLAEHEGRYEEAVTRLELGLAQLDGVQDEQAALETGGKLELWYAGVRYRQARYDESIEWSERAVEHAQAAGDKQTLARAYYFLDAAHSDLGRTEGVRYLELALPIFEELGDLRGQSVVLSNLGVHAQYEGRWDEALAYYRESRAVKQRAGDVVGDAIQANNEAEVLSDQGRLEEASALFEDALRACRASGHTFMVAALTSNLGRVAARSGRFEDAHEAFSAALDAFEELGARRFALETRARKAEALVLEGRYAEALELAQATREEARGLPVGGLEALLERLIGYALHQARRPDEARPHFEESLRLAREVNAPFEAGQTLWAIGLTGCDSAERDPGAESERILDGLGVVSLPLVPLP